MLKRFIKHVSKQSCWVWVGSRRKDGYGRFRVDGKTKLAHRVSYVLHNKMRIPEGMDVCHTCDNPGCVNPGHLFLATHVENMQDKIKKGRDHNQRKTHCPQGHEYSPSNTRLNKDGGRVCKTCANEASRRSKRSTL